MCDKKISEANIRAASPAEAAKINVAAGMAISGLQRAREAMDYPAPPEAAAQGSSESRGETDPQTLPKRRPQTMLQYVDKEIEGTLKHLDRLQKVRQRMITENVHRLPNNFFNIYGDDGDDIPF